MERLISFVPRDQLRGKVDKRLGFVAEIRAEAVLNQVIPMALGPSACTRVAEFLPITQHLTPLDRKSERWSVFALRSNPDIKLGNLDDPRICNLIINNRTHAKVLQKLGFDPDKIGWTEYDAGNGVKYLWVESPIFPRVFLVREELSSRHAIQLTQKLAVASNNQQLEKHLQGAKQPLAA